MLRAGRTEDPFSGEKILTQQDVASVITAIRNDLGYYRRHKLVSGNARITSILHELAGSLDQVEGDLNEFIMASRERGDENSGLISRWCELSSRMAKASGNNGPAVSRLMEKVKQLETRYMLYSNPKLPEEIVALSGEIRKTLTQKEDGISMDDLDSYLSVTSSLAALDRRIGTAASQGIAARSAKSIQTLRSYSNLSQRLMNEGMAAIRTKWTVIRYLVITLFTIACIFFLILVTSTGITKPLKVTAGYMKKIATGELPEEPLAPEGLLEIRSIDDTVNQVVKGLKEKATLARSLNANELDVKISLSGPGDILGRELVSLQQKMVDNAELQKKNDEENTKRRYINEGLAKFAEILRTRSNDILELGDVFVREVVKYLNALQGGLFLYNDQHAEGPVIELVSSFAYNRKKYMQKSLLPGEGLVGTCAREKQVINLTEIPEGYITITSGLGDARPNNLLLVPVLHENNLIGVLEIASLNRYQDHEIRFASDVAGSLGATIDYARNNQRTADLLTKSQQQALRMAEQEEEMRHNMEELKSSQEESTHREQEYRVIAEAIGNTFYMLEYSPDGTVRQVNDKLCAFLGRNRNELVGQRHQEMMAGTLKPDSAFWDTLKRKKQVTLVEHVKLGKKEYVLKEHFSVVQHQDKTISHFVNFLTAIPNHA